MGEQREWISGNGKGRIGKSTWLTSLEIGRYHCEALDEQPWKGTSNLMSRVSPRADPYPISASDPYAVLRRAANAIDVDSSRKGRYQ